jgi:hypothetical protein
MDKGCIWHGILINSDSQLSYDEGPEVVDRSVVTR